jgi:hypothetical protein
MAESRNVPYSPEVAEEILTRLADGETLRAICKSDHLPSDREVRRWGRDEPDGFAKDYRVARDLGLESWADQIIEEAFDSSEDRLGTDKKTGRPIWDNENVQRSRLKVDSLKWLLSKLRPERYGDKIAVTGAGDGPLQIEEINRLSPTERSQRILTILAEAQSVKASKEINGHDVALLPAD